MHNRVFDDILLMDIALSVDTPLNCAKRLGISIASVNERRVRLMVLVSGNKSPRLPKNNTLWCLIVEQALANFNDREILLALKDNTNRPRVNRQITAKKSIKPPKKKAEKPLVSSYPNGRIITVAQWIAELKGESIPIEIVPFQK